jgi:hypothetical protein
MNERDHKTSMRIAYLSESIGILFCIAAIWMGIVLLSSGHLTGFFGFAMLGAQVLPSLGLGLLLLVTGRILRTVTDRSCATAEDRRDMQEGRQQNSGD